MSIASDSEREALRRRVLGVGAACEPIDPGLDVGRDLRMAADAEGRLDLARVEGLDNLGQVLALGLTTLLGSDVFDVRFGFDGVRAMAEEHDAMLVRERVRVGIVNLLNADPRVRRVVDVELADGRLAAPSSGSRELEVRVVFEAVSGDQATVDLRGGAFGGS
jgi:hypothetical protein